MGLIMHHYSISDFDYALPDDLIAQFPTQNRLDSRLFVVPKKEKDAVHAQFSVFLEYVRANDLLVFNDTRVINARLFGTKISGGKVECLIERVLNDHQAIAHIRASHSPKIGSEILLENVLHAVIVARDGGLFTLEFSNAESLWELLEKYGHLPLPPYITRSLFR